MPPKIKPKIFIGSSTESLRLAAALQDALDYDTEAFVWHQDGFPPSKYPLEALEKHLDQVDFAIFFFTPEDITSTRGEMRNTVRDNVLFELGLFIGRLTRSRTFIVKPRGVHLDLPSDLYGITPVEYVPARSDDNLLASLGPAARKILEQVRSEGSRVITSEVGPVESDTKVGTATSKADSPDSDVLTEHSTLQDYNFAYWLATAQKDPARRREAEDAFLKSPLNDSGETLAKWEAWGAYVRMLEGEPVSLQVIRDQIAKFPNVLDLHRTLGDALKHYGDAEEAVRVYLSAFDRAEDIAQATAFVVRLIEAASTAKVSLDYPGLISRLLTLPRNGPSADASFSFAMRGVAEAVDLSQITQAIDEVRVKQNPSDSTLKFNLAHSFSQEDADLTMLYYESIPSQERNATAWNNLGVAYFTLHMPGLAVSAYETASENGETIADGNLANNFIKAGFFELARSQAQKAIAKPNPHNNAVTALSSIVEAQTEEEKKRSTARANAEKKQRFIRQLGFAALRLADAKIVGMWQTPDGTLEITAETDGTFVANGEFARDLGKNAMGLGTLFQPAGAPNLEKTTIRARLRRLGDAFEGTLTRKPVGPTTTVGILSSYNREDTIALYPKGDDALQVCIKGYQREEAEWRRVRTIGLERPE